MKAKARQLKDAWLIFFRPQELYWRARGGGYTSDVLCAGIYTRESAESQARSRPDDEARRLIDVLKEREAWLGSTRDGSVGELLGVFSSRTGGAR